MAAFRFLAISSSTALPPSQRSSVGRSGSAVQVSRSELPFFIIGRLLLVHTLRTHLGDSRPPTIIAHFKLIKVITAMIPKIAATEVNPNGATSTTG
jgi:hypothetical protein